MVPILDCLSVMHDIADYPQSLALSCMQYNSSGSDYSLFHTPRIEIHTMERYSVSALLLHLICVSVCPFNLQ